MISRRVPGAGEPHLWVHTLHQVARCLAGTNLVTTVLPAVTTGVPPEE